jgi:hypothetical protein
MPDHVIGEEKSSQRMFHFIIKNRFAKKHLIAMRPRNAGNTNLFKIGIQFAACPAITIDNGNVALVTQSCIHFASNPGDNSFRMIVPGRGKAGNFNHTIGELALDIDQLSGQSPARNKQ